MLRNITLIPTMPYSVPPIEDITDRLPKRGSWETMKGKKYTIKNTWDGKTYHTGFRKPEEIDTIVIHHSGPPEGTLESHASYHAKKWGAGISYHVVIDQGRIKQVNDLLSFTYHAAGHNTYTVAIMVNRDLSKGDLTSQERELLYAAILTVKSILPIKFIKGHNELCPTACPCTSLNKIREDVAALEHRMTYKDTDADKVARATAVFARISDLWGKASKDGPYRKMALQDLLILEPYMREKGLL